MPPVALNVLDLSQNWDTNTPGFARYNGPSIKWVKRVAFDGVGGMEIDHELIARRGDGTAALTPSTS